MLKKMIMLEKCASLTSLTMRVSLTPEEMDQDYLSHLLDFIKKKYEKKSSREHGYIVEIRRIKQILDQDIMRIIPNATFLLKVEALVYYPKVGDSLSVVIDKILPQGIYIEYEQIRILIPISFCEKHTVRKDFSSCYLQYDLQPEKTIRIGDSISIQLMDVCYEREGFLCVGKTINESS